MKLPEKKYAPTYNDELRRYASGWNSFIEEIEYLCVECGDEYAKESLLRRKEFALKSAVSSSFLKSFFRGCYDCIVEIEKLNFATKKAILVINLPNDYPLNKLKANIDIHHDLFGFNVYEYRNEEIKELPQKNGNKWHRGNERDFQDGYNACIDEILGDTE